MSKLSVTTIKSLTTLVPPVITDKDDVEIGQFCKAWVNFNGSGTIAIRDSFNVSSLTDNGTGDYDINFTTAFVDVNYAVSSLVDQPHSQILGQTVGSANIRTLNTSHAVIDTTVACVSVFSN
jgi:hypothetical protein